MQKKLLTPALLIASLSFASFNASAQSPVGLVAHWNFNGTTNDVTGHGNNGTGTNIVSTTGRSGAPNTAYYFAGVDATPSYVQVPYQSDLNLSNYSICATIKVSGFNSDICQVNTVLSRGQEFANGRYGLGFGDNPYDGDCNVYTPDSDVFQGSAGPNSFPNPDQKYTPTIPANQWMCVILTYDGTYSRLYVDGTLKYTVYGGGYAIGSSTQDLYIGADLYNSPMYHYLYNGIIDDICLYNRVLQPGEMSQYCSSTDSSQGSGMVIGGKTQGIESLTQNNLSVNISPNPAKDVLNIQGNLNDNIQVTITNALGQAVKNVTLNKDQHQISVSDLAPAIYFLKIQTADGQTASKEFVKQ